MKCWMMLLAVLGFNLYAAEVYEFKTPPKSKPVEVAETIIVDKPTFEKSIIKQAKAAIKERLIYQPEAVEFRDVQSIYGEGGLEFVCGEFNPVSRQGNYIGFIRFSFRVNKLVIADDDATLVGNAGDVLSGFTHASAARQPLDCR